jgi:hypothetical protein
VQRRRPSELARKDEGEGVGVEDLCPGFNAPVSPTQPCGEMRARNSRDPVRRTISRAAPIRGIRMVIPPYARAHVGARWQSDPEMSLISPWIRGIALCRGRSSSCRRGAGVHCWLALDIWAYPALMIVSRVCAASPASCLESCSQDSMQRPGSRLRVGCGLWRGCWTWNHGNNISRTTSSDAPRLCTVCRANQISARRTAASCKRASVRTTRESRGAREQMANGCWADDVAASRVCIASAAGMGHAEGKSRTRTAFCLCRVPQCSCTDEHQDIRLCRSPICKDTARLRSHASVLWASSSHGLHVLRAGAFTRASSS